MSSLKGQITHELHLLFERMKAFGEKKRLAKLKALAAGEKFWKEYNEKTYAHKTYKTYKPIAKQFAHWCVDRFRIGRLYAITPRMFKAYVRERMQEIKPNSMRTYMSAIAKLGEGLGQSEAFHRISSKMGKLLPKAEPERPTYASVEQAMKVLHEVEYHDKYKGLAMRLQLESGCRLVEAERLRREHLIAIRETEGKRYGVFLVRRGKNGKPRELTMSERTYMELLKAFEEKTKLVNYEGYRKAVYRANMKFGLESGGTHKARRFSAKMFFSDAYKALRSSGLTSWEASELIRKETAERMGHSRPGITSIYLRA